MLHVHSADMAPGPPAPEPEAGGGLPRWVWLGGLVVIMAIIIGLLGGD